MALLSKKDELLAAWRALSGILGPEGWRTIPVAYGGPCPLLAGRRFPSNEETLLVGFASIHVPREHQLPQGRGFLVSKVHLGDDLEDWLWIALRRQSAGSLDLFATMADDIVTMLWEHRSGNNKRLFQILLARIHAWQDFMHREGDGVLSAEAEVGLFGELELLRTLISAGIPALGAVHAWEGPLDGVQDFRIGTGAIEVKSTLSSGCFIALIGSLDQLDDSLVWPLFLAGIRLVLSSSGRTLPQQVSEIRKQMSSEPAALVAFDSCLISGGFLAGAAERYTRKFLLERIRILRVCEDFPRLTRANVASGIRKARYEVDLDMISTSDVEIGDALLQLGVTQPWN
ncbi:Putative PD-(D/E)XK family member [Nitrosospira multiformis]|uniref:Putative PD-(D/E)XK family member n=1 Tax=Nitrosospira multiformis TaxID=1231 RepID=A0A1H8IXR2_9PROT|nr:PD-(D/E)XK motif protein [Nitrosospira multiformis]SEN73384.1 Putative PD-(D/E)XK family member [Nitrosospira multiformis]